MIKILFIPVSGPKGAGEYIRSLTIAQKIIEELPECNIKFILNKHANYIKKVPFPVQLIDGTPTLNVNIIKKIILDEKPDLCIFDSGGRTSLFKFIKKQKIPIIYVSSRNSTRKKAFRFRWLRLISRHWIVQPVFVNGHLSRLEKIKIKLTGSPSPVFLETVFPEYNQERSDRFRKEIGLGNQEYILFSSGGGGRRGDGEQVPDIFAYAAKKVAEKTGLKCIAIMGPNYDGSLPELTNVITLKAVTNYHFIDLLNDAKLVVTGGGSSIAQGLALKKTCITAPAAADQAKRIRAAAKHNLVIPVQPNVDEISEKVISILNDNVSKEFVQSNVNNLGLTNGLSQIMTTVKTVCKDKLSDWGS